ncbi:hypothetical protein [Streptomyces sp. 900105245]
MAHAPLVHQVHALLALALFLVHRSRGGAAGRLRRGHPSNR